MKAREVRIAELKAHLSKYVRAAQGGEEIIIKDRDTPVARLSGIEQPKWPFETIPATRKIRGTHEMVGHKPPSASAAEIEKVIAFTREERTDDLIQEWLTSNGYTSTRR